MRAAQHDDVRLQGFIRGVGLVTMFRPRLTSLDLLLRQARVWDAPTIESWRRWTNIGMNAYLAYMIALMAVVVWVVLHTHHQWPAVLVTISYFLPPLADWYRARRGWL